MHIQTSALTGETPWTDAPPDYNEVVSGRLGAHQVTPHLPSHRESESSCHRGCQAMVKTFQSVGKQYPCLSFTLTFGSQITAAIISVSTYMVTCDQEDNLSAGVMARLALCSSGAFIAMSARTLFCKALDSIPDSLNPFRLRD